MNSKLDSLVDCWFCHSPCSVIILNLILFFSTILDIAFLVFLPSSYYVTKCGNMYATAVVLNQFLFLSHIQQCRQEKTTPPVISTLALSHVGYIKAHSAHTHRHVHTHTHTRTLTAIVQPLGQRLWWMIADNTEKDKMHCIKSSHQKDSWPGFFFWFLFYTVTQFHLNKYTYLVFCQDTNHIQQVQYFHSCSVHNPFIPTLISSLVFHSSYVHLFTFFSILVCSCPSFAPILSPFQFLSCSLRPFIVPPPVSSLHPVFYCLRLS